MLLQNYTPSDSTRARRYRRPRPGERDRVAEDMLDSDSEPAAPQETDGPAAGGAHRRRRRDRKAGFRKALTKFFTVFNGSVVQQERLVHYCKGSQCCRSPSETRQKMIVSILGLVLL